MAHVHRRNIKMYTSKFQKSNSVPKFVASTSFKAALVLSISGLLTTAAFAETCEGIQSAVNADGKYLYHYKDEKRPNLDLYKRYVRYENQCNNGNILAPRPVPGLENCYVQTCVDGDGREE
jgi:hypothetical protein